MVKIIRIISLSVALVVISLGAVELSGSGALAQSEPLWAKSFGGSGVDHAYSVSQTADGGYIVAGYTASFGAGNYDVYMIKTDQFGDTLQTRVYGGVEYDAGADVCQTGDGGYMIAASTQSFGAGFSDIWLLKTDSLGDTLWSKTCGTNDLENCTSMAQVDNGYVLTGRKGFIGPYDIWFVKIDLAGDTLWTCTFGGTESDFPYVVRQTSDNGYILFGTTRSFGAGARDIYMVKTAPEVGILENYSVKIEGKYTATILSGPLSLPRGGKCRVYDINGRVVEPDQVSRGIYFIELDDKIVQKVVKIRQTFRTKQHIRSKVNRKSRKDRGYKNCVEIWADSGGKS